MIKVFGEKQVAIPLCWQCCNCPGAMLVMLPRVWRENAPEYEHAGRIKNKESGFVVPGSSYP